jgi:uncharacterized protein YacL
MADLAARAFDLVFGLFWVGWQPDCDCGPISKTFAGQLSLANHRYMVFMYFGTILALKGKDDFYFVVPFVRFVPQDVHVPLAVVDSSALIDGRIVGLCASKFMGYALVIPQFVLDELHRIADSEDPVRRARGRRGLETLGKLRKMSHLDLALMKVMSNTPKQMTTSHLLAQNLKAKLLTMDFNTAKLAEFNSVEWLNSMSSRARCARGGGGIL